MNPTPLSIRPATAADCETICDIATNTFLDAFGHINDPEDMKTFIATHFIPEKIAASIATPGTEFLLVYLNNELAGYTKTSSHEIPAGLEGTHPLKLEKIYFLHRFTGMGLGKILYDECVARAKQKDHDWIWLVVWEQNFTAIRFYEKLGFTQFGKDSLLVGNDLQQALRLKKQL